MSAGKILIGVAAGVAAGVAVGILLAPEKGTDVREKLSGGEYLDDIKEGWNTFVDDVAERLGFKAELAEFAHVNVGGNQDSSGGSGAEERSAGNKQQGGEQDRAQSNEEGKQPRAGAKGGAGQQGKAQGGQGAPQA